MDTSAVVGIGQLGARSGTSLAEVVLVATAVVLGVLLLVIRMVRASAARKRKAGGAAYFDSDAAHYGPSGRTTPSSGVDATGRIGSSPGHRHTAVQPIAPTFSAPRPARKPHAAAPAQPRATPVATVATTARSTVEPSAPPPAGDVGGPPRSRPPSMVEPPVVGPQVGEPATSPVLAPLPGLRPKGALPTDLPAMPAPPPSRAADGPDSSG